MSAQTDIDPQKILKSAQTILLVDWAGEHVPLSLLNAGFTVYSYSPGEYALATLKAGATDKLHFQKVDNLPESIDIVNVYRPEEELEDIIKTHVFPLKAKTLWLQPPLTSANTRKIATENNIIFIENTDIAQIAMQNTKEPTLGHGKICYVEIPANDVAVSSTFYHNVFGWTIRTRGDGSTAFNDGINEVSGAWILGRKPATTPGLLVSIMVDSVSETIAAITANGCKIVNQMALSETEQIAWFTDPAGNVIGIYQHSGGGHGKICYVEIPAVDIEVSSNFYESIFPWSIRDKGSEHVAFDDSVGVVSGMWVKGRPSSPEPGLLIYVMVDDINIAINTVTAQGGKIVWPIGADAPEITARFSDPAGNVWGLYQEPQ